MPPQRIPTKFQEGNQGASPGMAALQGIAVQNQQQMDKMLKVIEKLQSENAEQVQLAAQAGGQAATEVANQVKAGFEAKEERAREQVRREEAKQDNFDQAKFIAKLQADAGREAALVAENLRANRDAAALSRESYKEKQQLWKENKAGAWTAFNDRIANGDYNTKEGRIRMGEDYWDLKMAGMQGSAMHDSRGAGGLRPQ